MLKEIKDILNKQLLRQKPTEAQFSAFTEALRNLKDSLTRSESEEHNKTYIRDFLRDAFYGETNLVNTAGDIDWAIYQTKDANSSIEVIIEAKSLNNQSEFPTKHNNVFNLNCKAMQELVLYFMRQRFEKGNISLKHCIITNGYEWFIIDAVEFEKHFANDKKFVRLYKEYENGELLFSGTKNFYTEIAKPQIDKVKQNIDYLYIDIRNLYTSRAQLKLYTILQPAHLLKQSRFTDSNKLNTAFYNELLHIIGLEEHKKDGKNVIERKPAARRNTYSLLESTIYQLDEITNEEEKFDIALNLVITWVNRVLFLKLLESQLISYHGRKSADQYRFLDIHTIRSFDELNELFFKVLAVPTYNRPTEIKEKFKNIPYLNSSLFEKTDNEHNHFRITELKPGSMPLFAQTVLKDQNGHHMKMDMDTLEYLFRFLEAYDFGSEQSDDITKAENKTLINASVLGLIFEKINGYKDGSFFTPAFITQYMCREAIERTVIQKFNEHFGWDCKTLTDIHNHDFDKQEGLVLLDSITICDPAVGSGHFLVSALNCLIAIRSELHMLYDENGKRLKDYNISIDNDELLVLDDEGELFHYNPNNTECQRVQKTLFDLKRHIIENNLFGADINPNSVNICRLRLWIELLKNAYYRDDTHELETLPNIDINIKCGDSLISRYPVMVGRYGGMHDQNLKQHILAYKKAVIEYKQTSNKETKKQITNQIQIIKQKLLNVSPQLDLFDKRKEVNKTEQLYQKLNSLEWTIEFPEVLDEEGAFRGFDIVIGNPPFISPKGLSTDTKKLYEKIYKFADDTYNHFTFRGMQIVKPNGILSLITPKTYWTIQTKRNMRDLLLSKKINFLFDAANPFDEVLVDTCIFQVQNCPMPKGHKLRFYDGSKDLDEPIVFEPIEQSTYINTQNAVIFKPTELNLKIWNKYGEKVKALYDKWWDKIDTSKKISDNQTLLEEYRASLKPGDIALLGCLTEGGQGLATANNGKYIAIRRSSKWATSIEKSRPEKLAEAIKQHPAIVNEFLQGQPADVFIKYSSEQEIVDTFDAIKERYGRDIFGQGYIFRLIEDSEIADVDSLTEDEKQNGIDTSKPYYVPYDKGDKDGNRWYLETPFAIAWSKENVQFLKTNSGKKGEGMPVVRNPQFYFKEGLCWSDINTTYLKCRKKQKSINDVKSMSLFGMSDKVPEMYIISIINSTYMSQYVDNFVNNTQTFQINDARQLPFIVPTQEELNEFIDVFMQALKIKQSSNDEEELFNLQNRLDRLTERLYGV